MTGIKEAATTIWTQISQAMKNDRMLADCVVTSGPETTAVLVQLAEQCMRPHAPWLNANILPAVGVEVITANSDGDLQIGYYSHGQVAWIDRFGSIIRDVVQYSFLPKREQS